ncbi:MAG: glycine cleavage system protein GcvH [Candidatus Hatepunaea meridiana]|nr:glycine cleavage system protein GcvH [Candidatus Hatepunaea meridiana]
MNIPSDLHYTKDHEWVKGEGEEATVGITDWAQGELGDIVYLELPEVGKIVISGKPFGTIEAVKAASEIFAPVAGEIVAVNGMLEDSPELINKSPYDDGWIIKIHLSDPEEIDTLLSADDYGKLIEV